MATSSRPTSRSINWDVVRVAAVASVVVQHATYTVSGVMPWLAPPPFVWGVEAGANTLMVISGFFLCVTLTRRPALGWWWHRIARLMPAFAVAVVVTYLATLLAARHGYWHPTVRDLVGNLALAQPWDPGVTWMDGSYWTLPLQVGAFSLAALAVLATSPWPDLWRRRAVLPVLAWLGVTAPVVLGLTPAGCGSSTTGSSSSAGSSSPSGSRCGSRTAAASPSGTWR